MIAKSAPSGADGRVYYFPAYTPGHIGMAGVSLLRQNKKPENVFSGHIPSAKLTELAVGLGLRNPNPGLPGYSPQGPFRDRSWFPRFPLFRLIDIADKGN